MDSVNLSHTFGRRIPVTQCSNGQEAIAIAAQTRAKIRAGYPQPVSWRSLQELQTELTELRAERDFIKSERDQYRALTENLKNSNEKLAKEVRELRAVFNMVAPVQPVNTAPFRAFSLDKIQQAVCGFYQVTKIDLLGDRRSGDIVHPRHVAIYIAREYTGK